MKPKEPRISVRISPGLKARIESVIERTGIDEATLVRNCIEALCDHVERHGQISFPMSLNANGVIPIPRYPKSSPTVSLIHDKPKPVRKP